MHNHLLPMIDDGSNSLEHSLLMLKAYSKLGYKKLIVTPHVIDGYYSNTPDIISRKFDELIKESKVEVFSVELAGFAAEYMVDDSFYSRFLSNEEFLTFKGKHLLLETPFLNQPMFFSQLIFELQNQNYIPVFAHPERYVYLHGNYQEAEKLFDSGIKFQINLLSLIGYYSPEVFKFCKWLIDKGYYHFLGTDAHKLSQLELLTKVASSKLFSKIDFTKVENASDY
ncbi:MAG: CpsB/CapC family capsule biosynthesis tyrosine phosphatase [Bacteroidota bacterium]|nr:CpsB/CapC family capsule biosynthesis tyrosine phosphatase [Bacteroidota bacterium]